MLCGYDFSLGLILPLSLSAAFEQGWGWGGPWFQTLNPMSRFYPIPFSFSCWVLRTPIRIRHHRLVQLPKGKTRFFSMAFPFAYNALPLLGLLVCSYLAHKTQFQYHHFLNVFHALPRQHYFFLLCCIIELSVIAVIVGLDTCLSYLFEDIQSREHIFIIFNSPALSTMLHT